MEEEISLRDILHVLWEGKRIVATTTVVSLFFALVFIFFIRTPVYQSQAAVMIHQPAYQTGIAANYINQTISPELFIRTAQTPEVLQQVLAESKLQDTLSVSNVRDSFTFFIDDASEDVSTIVDITLKSVYQDQINAMTTALISQTQVYMEKRLNERLTELETQYQTLVDKETNELATALSAYQTLRAGEGLPTLLLLSDMPANVQYVLDENERFLEEMHDLDKEKQLEYKHINARIQRLFDSQLRYEGYLNDVQNTKELNIIRDSVRMMSTSYSPDRPISPHPVTDLSIALVLGLLLGVFLVFLLHSLQETTPQTS